jgi:hypothetical protein
MTLFRMSLVRRFVVTFVLSVGVAAAAIALQPQTASADHDPLWKCTKFCGPNWCGVVCKYDP